MNQPTVAADLCPADEGFGDFREAYDGDYKAAGA
jgi:hypothetical protein